MKRKSERLVVFCVLLATLVGTAMTKLDAATGPSPAASRFPDEDSDVDANNNPAPDGLTNAVEAEVKTKPDKPDSDFDGITDGSDAVPTVKAMKVRAAPEASYAIIDLGTEYSVAGVNDNGQVLLTHLVESGTNTIKLWTSGTMTFVYAGTDKALFLAGPLQDGSVYRSGETEDDESNSSNYRVKMHKWPGTGDSGYQAYHYGGPVYSESGGLADFPFTAEEEIMPDSTGPAKTELLSNYEWAKSIVDGYPSELIANNPLFVDASIQAVNDTENVMFNAIFINGNTYGIPSDEINDSVNWGARGGVYGWLTAISGSSTVVASERGASYLMGDLVPDGSETGYHWEYGSSADTFEGRKGDRVLVNNDQFVAYQWSPASLPSFAGGAASVDANGITIPGCLSLNDITSKTTPEGPYILGSAGQMKTLWCYNGGAFDKVELGTDLTLQGSGGLVGRGISESLVIPMGDKIWRNSRTRSLAELCGIAATGTTGWTEPYAYQVSPEKNLLIGSAKKDNEWHSVLLVPVDMAVDANRDGVIKFAGSGTGAPFQGKPQDKTEETKPFRFWCNDDYDFSDIDYPAGIKNSEWNWITCKRDLEDFSRLHINIGGLHDAIANGTIQVGLEWRNVTGTGSPSIKVYQAAEPDGGEEYIRGGAILGNENWANTQILPPFKTAIGTIDATGGFKFPATFWESNSYGLTTFSANHPNRYILFEGVTEGKGQLVLTFWKGTTKIGEGGGVWINLLNVRKMYRRAKITVTAPDIPGPWSNDNPPPLSWVWDLADGVSDMDPSADKKTIVFVHGWRMTYGTTISWGDTTFKRLWHLGYKGSFYSFRWPTYSEEDGGYSPIDAIVPGGSTYNPSEYRAWLSGPALASFVNGLPNPDSRYLIAHSMGNVIAGAALRSDMQVTRYAACNAAMSALAYDSTIVDYSAYVTPDSPDPDSDSSTRTTFGLANKFNPGNTTIISFALNADSATSGLWNANNLLFKPQAFFDGTNYEYASAESVGNKLAFVNFFGTRRSITSVPEAMGYVTQSRANAAGTKLTIGGSISAVVNMGTDFHFGTEHSAQWNWSIQPTYPFWKEILNRFQIDVGDR